MEPIAIIGMSCRFPGANRPAAFWQLLCDGADAVREVPAERWDIDALYDADPSAPGKMNTRWGGFLDEVDKFDPLFFRISPREARCMDPQQRLMLELSWEALEDAGLVPARLGGSATGVFFGFGLPEYQLSQLMTPALISGYTHTGFVPCILSNRISYFYDFRGPSLSLDTACSSALTAVHLACQSLHCGESTLALAGAVNLIISPQTTIGYSKLMAMSPDGRCKTFDAEANGYVRGEGGGLVVLKKLSAALADGDQIYAVIQGSAINQDGRTNGLTAPNRFSQEEVLRRAYAQAGVSPGQVQYVETHGTGTLLGDPIEMMALGKVLAEDRSPDKPCAIGSVKTNVGHLESAAGIASLIKVTLAIRHRMIPPSLHFKTPNPHIPFDKLPLKVQQNLGPWPDGSALAGISSFGFGGTNVHLVLSDVLKQGNGEMTKTRLRVSPGAKPQAAMSFSSSSHLLPLSAHSPEALRAVAQSYKHFLADEKSQSGASLEDICYTVANHRSHHDHRLSITADDKESCLNCLDAFLAGQPAAGMTAGRRLPNRRPKIAFLFTGQGSQYVNMGRQLYETQPVFRQTLQRCDELLRPLLDKPLLSVLYPSLAHQASIHTPQPLKPDAQAKADADSPLNQTAYTQPALFALEYSVAQQWRAWGVEPDIVIGHSVGEYVAACVAGVFSLETGLKLIAERGRLMQQLPADGAMASVFAGLERVQDAIGPREQELSLAAINGPEQVVISGKRQAVQAVLQSLEKEGIAAHPLNVSHAFHSPLMEPILRPLEQAARQAQCTPPQIKLISNLTGQLVDGDIDAAYWRRHARQPVQFAAGMQALQEFGCDLFIEIGPHPALMGMVERVPDTLYLPSLRRGGDDCRQMLESLGAAYVRGVEVNWASLYEYVPRRRVSLPAYPFQRERYWWDQIEQPEAVGSARPQGTGLGSPQLPRSSLLGGQLHAAIPIYQTQFDQERLPWVDEHRVCEFAVVPGTVWLEMALAAAKSHTQADAVGLQQVEFRRMLLLAAGQTRTVQLILTKEAAESAAFEISSILENAEAETSWSHHARGRIVRGERLLTASAPLSDLRFRLREQIAPETFYDQLRRRGLHYGPAFQGVKHLWRRDREALGRLELPEDIERQCQDYQLHPVLLGTAFQLIAAALPAAILQAPEAGTFVPVGLADLCFYHRPRTPCWCYVFLRHIDAGKAEADLRLLEDNGQAALEIAGLQLEALPSLALQASNAASSKPETPAKELPEVALDLDGLQTADAAGRHALLQSYLRKQLAGALGLAEAKLDVATPLHRFGLDSIMVFKLGMRLERDLRVKLKMADLIDGPSVAALATMVLQKMTQA